MQRSAAMFDIGDKIVYPMHGAGIIESIEERKFSAKKRYYIMKMPVGEMKVMIPTNCVNDVGFAKLLINQLRTKFFVLSKALLMSSLQTGINVTVKI